MKLLPSDGIFAFLVVLLCSRPAYGMEISTVKFGESLPLGWEEQFVIFESGPHGEVNPAQSKYLELQKKKEAQDKTTPALQGAGISFIDTTPVLTLPGRAIWTYRISGIPNVSAGSVVKLSLGKTPESLVLPASCNFDKRAGVIFEQVPLKGTSRDLSMPDAVTVSGNTVYFEKKLLASSDTVDVSIVATSKSSDYLIEVRAEFQGYKPIKALLPGPCCDFAN